MAHSSRVLASVKISSHGPGLRGQPAKQTQEKAANQALREMLQRAEADPVMGERMNRAKALKTEMENLLTPVSKSASATS